MPLPYPPHLTALLPLPTSPDLLLQPSRSAPKGVKPTP